MGRAARVGTEMGTGNSILTESVLDVSALLPETGLTESAAQETQEPSWKELADKLDTTVLDSQTDIGTEEGNETSFLPDVELQEARIPSASAELELIDIPDAEAPTVEAEAPSTGTLSAQTADIPTAQTADTTDDSDDENGNGSNSSSSGNPEGFEWGNGGYERLMNVHEDLQGNTRYHTKTNGNSFAEMTYDAWGLPVSTNKLLNNDHGNYVYAIYTGHIFDTTLDIYFCEGRFYDANTRQWMAMDLIKDEELVPVLLQ